MLSLYEETKTIGVGTWGGVPRWVEVRTSLSRRQARRMNAVSFRHARDTSPPDPDAFGTELLVASVVAWNFTLPDGTELPLPPFIAPDRDADAYGPDPANDVRRESISTLPDAVFDKLLIDLRTMAADRVRSVETFPEQGESPAAAPRPGSPGTGTHRILDPSATV